MMFSIINTPKKSVSRINRLLLFVIFIVITIYLSSLIKLRSINMAFDKYGIIGKCFILFIVVLVSLNIFVLFNCIINDDNIEGLACPPFVASGVSVDDDIMSKSTDTPFMSPFGYTCSAGMMGPIPSARDPLDQSLIKQAAIVNSTGQAQGVYDIS